MTPAQFLAATGVPLRPGLAQQSVDLLAPGDVYGDRINVMDLRVAKVLRFGGKRLNVGLDLYNLFNANPPTAYETVFESPRLARDGCSRRPFSTRGRRGSTCSSTSDDVDEA